MNLMAFIQFKHDKRLKDELDSLWDMASTQGVCETMVETSIDERFFVVGKDYQRVPR